MRQVVQLIPFLNDAGAETVVKNYCLHIDKSKFNLVVVTIFDYCKDCYVYRSIKESGVSIISIYDEHWQKGEIRQRIENYGRKTHKSILGRAWNKFFADRINNYIQLHFEKKTGRKLSKLFKVLKPDVIHAHLHVQNYLRWVKVKSKAFFYTCHSEPYRYFSGKEYINTEYLINNKHLRIVALHSTMQADINRLFYVNNTIVLNNWIDFSKIRNVEESKTMIRASIGLPEDAFVIGTIGRITEYKNQAFLVEVLKHISQEKSNSILVIVGNGSEKLIEDILSRAQKYSLEKKVVFLGVRNDVERIYKSLDVFMLPSYIEGFPMVAIEAQASGAKCLLSDRISRAVCLSEKTFFLPLEDSKTWADYAFSDITNDGNYGDINDYDILVGIKKLEQLYEVK